METQLIKYITMLECIQRRATKYILNDYNSSYKSRLQQLNLLPLMYIFELNDLMFFIKSSKSPTDNFNINHHITFAEVWNPPKVNSPKDINSNLHHFYFNRIARLYNCLPVLDLSLSTNIIKHHITNSFWTYFTDNFHSERACTYHFLCPCYRCSREPIPTNFNQL